MIIIRNAKIEDIEGVAKVLKESYNIDDIEEAKKIFRDELKKDHHYIIAEQLRTILGIVTWTVHDLPKHQLAELNRIAVLPEYRGKGVAKLLFNGLIKKCSEFYKENGSRLRKLYLLTHESNTRAHIFYEKMGFNHETTLDNHYYDEEDEYVFSMFFDEEGKTISNSSNKS
ncbi:GNAT family N-acetyltransferase [Candidatus Woesearchaeota archaeon]|nr:GNAT family N-acetyltransferase [Candidatus Woesearchaeota archaeon]